MRRIAAMVLASLFSIGLGQHNWGVVLHQNCVNLGNFPSGANAGGVTPSVNIQFTGIPSEGEWIRVDEIYYTFSAVADTEYEIVIGGSVAANAYNFVAAINREVPPGGEPYHAGIAAHPTCRASLGADGWVTLRVDGKGSWNNDWSISDNSANINTPGSSLGTTEIAYLPPDQFATGYAIWSHLSSAKVTRGWCVCQKDSCSATAVFNFEDGDGNDMTGAITCDGGEDSVTADNLLSPREELAIDVKVGGDQDGDRYLVCWEWEPN